MGAYVRATGSGAGCGNHWPLCDGEVIPRAQHIQTLIEFTHRVTSGIALLAVMCLWIWTCLAMPRRHPARYAGTAAALLIFTEALLGASLVLFEHVAQDNSIARTVSLSLHSANTMLLLAAISLTAFWIQKSSSYLTSWSHATQPRVGALLLTLLIYQNNWCDNRLGRHSVSGVVVSFLARAGLFLQQSLPLTAADRASGHGTGNRTILDVGDCGGLAIANKLLRRLAWMADIALLLQLTLGALNIVLLAPIWLQIVHLLVADILWINVVLFSAESLTAIIAEVRHVYLRMIDSE